MIDRSNEWILSASTIRNTSVRNLSNEEIGTIKDLMVDSSTGSIVYAVLSVDTGFLNLSSKYFAIPWKAFKTQSAFNGDSESDFILDINKERLENSPGFDKDNWPSGPQREFVDEVNAFYGIDKSSGFDRSIGGSQQGYEGNQNYKEDINPSPIPDMDDPDNPNRNRDTSTWDR